MFFFFMPQHAHLLMPIFACPLVVLACESLHVCTVCIWRCEHARFCVEVFYALYKTFHSFIHMFQIETLQGKTWGLSSAFILLLSLPLCFCFVRWCVNILCFCSGEDERAARGRLNTQGDGGTEVWHRRDRPGI